MAVRNGFWLALLAWCLTGTALAEEAAKKAPPAGSDVRVLIDVSGSMKKNDPRNLRVPALKLLTNLLPKGASAGVWLFGEKVEPLVAWQPVDKNWQQKAEAAANKVHSRGLFTNIGAAIDAVRFGWDSPDLKTKRSIILLTDGMLDISKEPGKNEAARRQLLESVLPELKASGAVIHTIALSREADAELLGKLSGGTDGWFQSAEKAEDLQRIFLKIFEQATTRDSLPLDNNRFKVDAAIEEFTLLVFRKPDSAPTELVTPSGKTYSSEHAAASMRWHRDANYDLVTVEKPEAGEWVLKAALDPDNRVMVVSNLSLRTPEIPNNLLAGEDIVYAASLVEDGEPIKRKDFLELVQFKLTEAREGKSVVHDLQDDGEGPDSVKGDGRYSAQILTGDDETTIELDLVAKSATFERKRHHALHVYGAPFEHSLHLAEPNEPNHLLTITPKEAVVDLESLQLQTLVTLPDGTQKDMPLSPGQGNQLLLPLPVIPTGGEYVIRINAQGRTAAGRAFRVSAPPITLATEPLPGHEAAPKPEPAAPPEVKPEAPAHAEAKPDAHAAKPESSEEDGHINWPLWVGLGLGLNIVLVGGGYFLARLLKKRRLAAAAELAGELGE